MWVSEDKHKYLIMKAVLIVQKGLPNLLSLSFL